MVRRLRTLLVPVLATTPVRPLVLPPSDLTRVVAGGTFDKHWNTVHWNTVHFTAQEPFCLARPRPAAP